MNWKLLILIGVLVIMTYVGVTYYFTGQPGSLPAFSAYVVNGTQNIVQNASSFIQDKWQLVTGTLGVALTAIFGLYRTLHGKFTQVQQTVTTAQTQVKHMEAQAVEQYNTMKATIDTQETTITSLKQEVTAYEQKLVDAPTQMEIDAKQRELDNLRFAYEELFAKFEAYKLKTQTVYQ